jgi:hypothetical protein
VLGENVPGGLGKPLTLEDFFPASPRKGCGALRTKMHEVCEALGFKTLLNLVYAEREQPSGRRFVRFIVVLIGDGDGEHFATTSG